MTSIHNCVEMAATPKDVFAVVSNLASWPRYLPHYRWIRVVESNPNHQIVHMGCYRGFIPIDWWARYQTDTFDLTLTFNHLKYFTKGMKVVWTLKPTPDGLSTLVTISHDLNPVIARWGKFIACTIIGNLFIDYVATRTLRHFAKYFQDAAAATTRII